MKEKLNYVKFILIALLSIPFLFGIPLLIHRGLHGEYGFDSQCLSITLIAVIPFIFVFFLRDVQLKLRVPGQFVLAAIISIGTVLYYLSRNGLWCAQHPSVTREMCAKLKTFASFASSYDCNSWWLTRGDLLAIQRGRVMPLAWEHDIDVCITPEEFPQFEETLASHARYFEPEPVRHGEGHWYIPVDMKKLGLRARDAEEVMIDVWTCPKAFQGNITQTLYCNGYMNIPESPADRHELLTKEYGDYSIVKYEHHARMCRLWNG